MSNNTTPFTASSTVRVDGGGGSREQGMPDKLK
jgi:hypothetical protein